MTRPSSRLLLALAVSTAAAGSAWAEKADRTKPLVVESDNQKAVSVDLAKKITTLQGNVSVSQGTLLIRADRMEIKEDAAGRYLATAQAGAGRLAVFRQKRDKVEEFIEGQADRIEYDGATERVRLIGNAKLRLLRAGAASDEATASTIVYDQRADTITFEGGTATTGTPGKARLVFVPRETPAAEPAASAASGAAR
ncbi:lipopolysaccharide transport periplasmic protein LptA [Ideonella sp.]|uniref:lipopolysaccharide transport periplasmic protein LptA n=1 Tax=Ideonella sp. TaxID=1929293 RepID=UPI0037C15032